MFERVVRTHTSLLDALVPGRMLSRMASRKAVCGLAAGALLGANLGCGRGEVVSTDAGTDIPMPMCTDGIPAPSDRAPTQVTYLVKGTVSGPMAVDATDLYFYYRGASQYGLWAVDKRGGQPRLLVDGVTPSAVVSDGPWLYFTNGRRKKADPAHLQEYPGQGGYLGHDATHLYLAVPADPRGYGGYRLEKVSKENDTDRTVLAPRVIPTTARVLYGYVVWQPGGYGEYRRSTLERVSTKGGAIERIELRSASLVAADCNYLYFAGIDGVSRMRHGGSEPVTFGQVTHGGIWAIDAEGLYVLNGKQLSRLSLRTGEVAKIAEEKNTLSDPSLALDETTVYFGTKAGIAMATK